MYWRFHGRFPCDSIRTGALNGNLTIQYSSPLVCNIVRPILEYASPIWPPHPFHKGMLLMESNAALPNLSPIFDHSLILLASLVLIFSLSMFVAIILTSSLASASSMDSLISTILHSFLSVWTLSLVVIYMLSSNPLFAWTQVNVPFFSHHRPLEQSAS